MKGIVLAGGSATRMRPMTDVVNKHLLPVYDKPMVYYPLSVLLLAGVRDILVVGSPGDLPLYAALLGDGSRLGVRITYAGQDEPRGVADALIVGRDFVGEDAVALILGDNLFYGAGLARLVQGEVARVEAEGGCTLFAHRVHDPERYGVVHLDGAGRAVAVEEKPARPRSDLAVTGLYLYGAGVSARAATLVPSARGELEITALNQGYVAEGAARVVVLGRGMVWLDTGTPGSLLEASHFVQVVQQRQGTFIACLEEIAHRMGWIDAGELRALGQAMGNSPYGRYILEVAAESPG